MGITARRLWGDHEMIGWKAQFGKCLVGIILIGIALALFGTVLLYMAAAKVIGPEDGPLAEGESGPGRMSEPAAIVAALAELAARSPT